MHKIFLTAALAACTAMTVPAMAQTSNPIPARETSANDTVSAPDGSDASGFEPYIAIMGGFASFDNNLTGAGIPDRANGNNRKGALVEGIVGANIPIGAFFVGVEGNVAKGVDGTIDW